MYNELTAVDIKKMEEEIEYRGISQKVLSKQMGVSYSMLNEILNGKRPVTETLALCFEAALGIEAEMLTNMQTRYNMLHNQTNSQFQLSNNILQF